MAKHLESTAPVLAKVVILHPCKKWRQGKNYKWQWGKALTFSCEVSCLNIGYDVGKMFKFKYQRASDTINLGFDVRHLSDELVFAWLKTTNIIKELEDDIPRYSFSV